MHEDLDRDLREAGRRLREAYPPGLAGGGRGRRPWPKRSLAAAACLLCLALLLAARSFLREETPHPAPVPSIGSALLVHPAETAPIHPPGEPICALLSAESARSSVRVFLDETEMTSLAERHDQVILLEPPWPLPPGPHLLRFEIEDNDGALLGEPSWILFVL